MPIFLEAPSYRPGGPDGKGWNRLSLNAHIGTSDAQCGIQPRSYATLWESRERPRCVKWGGYGRCIRKGNCDGCPVLTRKPRELRSFMPTVLVRLMEHYHDAGVASQSWLEPWVMNRPRDGWGEYGEPWTWADLARLEGWAIGRLYRDPDGEGFLLHATRRHFDGVGGSYGFGEEVVTKRLSLEEAYGESSERWGHHFDKPAEVRR